jgi:hypothetical protein
MIFHCNETIEISGHRKISQRGFERSDTDLQDPDNRLPLPKINTVIARRLGV